MSCSASYLDHMGNDLHVVNAARISFNTESEVLDATDIKLIKYLAEHNHSSPFEHCTLSVEIDCPIYISKQIMRHRTFSYNEISRRYTSDNIRFFHHVWRKQADKNRQSSENDVDINNQVEFDLRVEVLQAASKLLYDDMLKAGIAREQARSVLPQSLMTSFIMTGNLWNWSRFVRARLHKDAQKEIQWIAADIKDILIKRFPHSMGALLNET